MNKFISCDTCFVDDCLLMLRKRTQKQMLQEFNNFDNDLNCTAEEIKKRKFDFP